MVTWLPASRTLRKCIDTECLDFLVTAAYRKQPQPATQSCPLPVSFSFDVQAGPITMKNDYNDYSSYENYDRD